MWSTYIHPGCTLTCSFLHHWWEWCSSSSPSDLGMFPTICSPGRFLLSQLESQFLLLVLVLVGLTLVVSPEALMFLNIWAQLFGNHHQLFIYNNYKIFQLFGCFMTFINQSGPIRIAFFDKKKLWKIHFNVKNKNWFQQNKDQKIKWCCIRLLTALLFTVFQSVSSRSHQGVCVLPALF